MQYTYECVLEREDDWWLARFPQLGGGVAQGRTREEVLSDAEDLLVLLLAEDIEEGRELPPSSHWVGFAPVSVDITPEVLEETHYDTIEGASTLLDMPEPGIRKLILDGELETKQFGSAEKVSLESLNRYQKALRQVCTGPTKAQLTSVTGGNASASDAKGGASKTTEEATALQA